MKERRDSKNIVIGALLVAVVFMAVGYAALSTTLSINGTAKLQAASWDVHISDVSLDTANSIGDYSGTDDGDITVSGTSATFTTDLVQPGTKVVYDITVANTGSLEATRTDFNPSSPTTLSVSGADTKYVDIQLTAVEADNTLANTDGVHHYKLTITYKDVNVASDLPTTELTYNITTNFNYAQA